MRRHAHWMALGAVVISLALILGFLFHWLSRLEEVSAVAYQASLRNYAEAVTQEVGLFYESLAERTLNLPASIFHEERRDEAAHFWATRPLEGARRMFLVDYTQDIYGQHFFFDPTSHELRPLPSSDEAFAIIIACSPWQVISLRGAKIQDIIQVDERDPANRVVFHPLVDGRGTNVGTIGFVVDETYLLETLLPAVTARVFPEFLSQASQEVLLQVTDQDGRIVYRNWDEDSHAGHAHKELDTRSFGFVFADWQIHLYGGGLSPVEWARSNRRFNLWLSVILAAVLLGAVVVTWRVAQRAVKLSQMKSDFVSNVSHELRTPLASIRVLSELLHRGRIDDPVKVREYGTRIEGEVRRLSGLVDKILDFSRIESGRKTYTLTPTPLIELVRETVEGFRSQSVAREFQVHLHIPRDDPAGSGQLWVDADRTALGEALRNLLDNAIKYSGTSREVDVTVRKDGNDGLIEVADRGIGIERSEHSKIFERFHRVGQGLVHDVRGSGLGLSIVKHILTAHGGRITVESTPSRGSTFGMRIPLLDPASAAIRPTGNGSLADGEGDRAEGATR